MKQWHFSLHDVCPAHRDRLDAAEALFAELGITKVTYLFVPDFHHKGRAEDDPWFRDFCRRERPFEVEWALHGFFHLENPEAAKRTPDKNTAFKRKHMTGGEGEFLALTLEEQIQSIQNGIESFAACLNSRPKAFVPPAWLHNDLLVPALQSRGIDITENHQGIITTGRGTLLEAPVITWATRDIPRKYGSLIVCPALAWMWRHKPLLRVACHPHDFDHTTTKSSIRSLLRQMHAQRRAVHLYDCAITA